MEQLRVVPTAPDSVNSATNRCMTFNPSCIFACLSSWAIANDNNLLRGDHHCHNFIWDNHPSPEIYPAVIVKSIISHRIDHEGPQISSWTIIQVHRFPLPRCQTHFWYGNVFFGFHEFSNRNRLFDFQKLPECLIKSSCVFASVFWQAQIFLCGEQPSPLFGQAHTVFFTPGFTIVSHQHNFSNRKLFGKPKNFETVLVLDLVWFWKFCVVVCSAGKLVVTWGIPSREDDIFGRTHLKPKRTPKVHEVFECQRLVVSDAHDSVQMSRGIVINDHLFPQIDISHIHHALKR